MNKQNQTSEFLPPVQFQNGESVRLRLGHHTNLPCRILAIKSTAKFIYYDLEVWLYPPEGDVSGPEYTRLYHVESKFVFERDITADQYPKSLSEPDLLKQLDDMCVESLDPDSYQKWSDVMWRLKDNRRALKKADLPR